MDTKTYEETYDALCKVLTDSKVSNNDAIGLLETIKAVYVKEIIE